MLTPKTKGRIIAAMRRIFRWTEEKRLCRKKAEIKATGKVKYLCATCKKVYDRKETMVDHIRPVVGPEGFTTWDAFIDRLFCEEANLQVVCKADHRAKTLAETKARAKTRKENKKKI